MDALLGDIKVACRLIIRNPAFSYSAALMLVGLVASYLPAHRATRIDPVTMLRQP